MPPPFFVTLHTQFSFTGAILGDSLGLATEGLSKPEIEKFYGKGPIRFGMDEGGIPFIKDEFRSNFEER